MRPTPLLLACALLLAAQAHSDVQVSLVQKHHRADVPAVLMNNGAMSYDLALFSKAKGALDPKGFHLEGVGLFPSKRGWSGIGGFLEIVLDGKPLLPCPFQIAEMASGPDGVAVLRGQTEAGPLTLTFRAQAMSDCLLLSVDLPLKKPAKTVEIKMTAYPGEFAKAAAQRKHPLGPMDTRVLTPLGEETRREGPLDPNKQYWLFLYDANYDPAKNAVLGGEMCACGILYNPADAKAVSFEKRPGHVQVTFTLPGGPAGERVTADFALWEFTKSNEDGKRVMQSIVLHRD
ncbi:MAG TPA: hypothetical protein P5137_10510 [Candidatus Brocadiia bacterium]|nr:hypothetical protein [Candidatus Brocadiia bacterium]